MNLTFFSPLCQSGLACHGADLASHGNYEGHTSSSANFSSADIFPIAIVIVSLLRRTISSFTCRLAPQNHLLFTSLPIPGHNPHPHLPPLPGHNHIENPPRSIRRLTVPRCGVCLTSFLSDICVHRRRMSLGSYYWFRSASTRQFGWMGDLGRLAKHWAQWLPIARAAAKEAICVCPGEEEGYREDGGLNIADMVRSTSIPSTPRTAHKSLNYNHPVGLGAPGFLSLNCSILGRLRTNTSFLCACIGSMYSYTIKMIFNDWATSRRPPPISMSFSRRTDHD